MTGPLHLVLCRWTAVAAAAFGTALWLWPGSSDALPSGPLAPLHARCIGAVHLALACGLWSARRRLDPAAAMPLLRLLACWGGVCALAWLAAGHPPTGWAWPAVAGTGTTAAAVLVVRDAVAHAAQHAPAERADPGWAALALVATALGAALLLVPGWIAVRWPWRMGPPQAAAWGAPLLGFAAAAWTAARERRCYVREPVLHAWLTLALGVLAASALHRRLLDPARGVTWVWFGTLLAVAGWGVAQVGTRRRHR